MDGASTKPCQSQNNAAFTSIEQVERNVDCLASLLKPALNLESRVEVRSLKNPSSSDEMAGFIATAASVAEDLLLIYYSGHGLINSDGKLALSHSATELGMADFQALEYEKIRRACLASPARLKIVILDCCYSGAAVQGLLTNADDLRGQVIVNGSYVVASSPMTRPSHVLPGELTTAFTGRMIELIEKGPDARAKFSLNELMARLREVLRADGLPEPQVVDNNQVGDVLLFRHRGSNPGPVSLAGEAPPASEINDATHHYSRRHEPVPGSDSLEDSGLFSIFLDLNDEDNRAIAVRIRNADDIFFVAHTGYNAMVSQYQGALRRAVEGGGRLRVVISDPNGPLMKASELTQRLCPSVRQAGEIGDVLEACHRHQRHAVEQGHAPNQVQVRLYRGVPSANLLLVDGWLRMIPYLPLLDAADSPVFEFEFDTKRPTRLIQKYLRVLESLWKGSKIVDLEVYARE